MTAATLWFLDFGRLIDQHDDGTTSAIPVPGYLIRSASGRHYLVDTGNPATLIGAETCAPWYGAGADIKPENDPVACLAAMNLTPRDIDAVIATHLDFDHAGRYDVFGPLGTDVWIQRAQMRSALSDTERYDPALWKISGLRWRQLDGDFEIEPGIRLIRTDGHATGHQSLFIVTTGGPVILAADAIDSRRMLETRAFADYYDAAATNASIDKLVALANESGGPIVFGHDLAQWETLPMSPRPYSQS